MSNNQEKQIKQVKIINANLTSRAEELTNEFLANLEGEVLDIKISGQGQDINTDNRLRITVLIIYLKTVKPRINYV